MSEKRKFTRDLFFKTAAATGIFSKDILKKGSGDNRPFPGCKVLFRCTSRYDASDSSSGAPGAPEVLKLGGLSSKFTALEYCLTLMKKGEKSVFTMMTDDSGCFGIPEIVERYVEVSIKTPTGD